MTDSETGEDAPADGDETPTAVDEPAEARDDASTGASGEPPADSDDTPTGAADDGDTFGVGIHVTDAEFQFVVHVPSDIDAGWTDPEAFQQLVERTVWDRLDRTATLRAIDDRADVGETVTLGRVTLRPDGTVVEATFDEGVTES